MTPAQGQGSGSTQILGALMCCSPCVPWGIHGREREQEARPRCPVTHGGLGAVAGGAAAAAEAVPPVLAHITARLDVLLGWERVCHLQLPAVPHPAGNSRGQGHPEASSPRWFPSVPSRTPRLCPRALAAPKLSLHPCIYPHWITLSFSQILLFTCSHHPVLLPARPWLETALQGPGELAGGF